MRSNRYLRPLFVLMIGTLAAVVPAEATPAFARRHGTSCQTCHVAYPKLNSFGEAYRLRGYRMPGETEAQIKQPDQALGAPAYKRVWPNSVWPGAIPSQIPLAILAEFEWRNVSRLEGEETEKIENDFVFPSEVALVVSGTAGDHFAYFGEIAFEKEAEEGVIESGVELEHFDVRIIRPFKDSLAFNARVGSVQPELVSTFDHARRLTLANYDSMFGVATANPGGAESVGGGGHHGGGNGVALPAIATGFDLYGIVSHRFLWAAGVFNGVGPGEGSFDGNSSKDLYGRVAYKWGGMDLDGSNAATFAGSDKNWRERSFRIGGFAYSGDGEGVLFGVEPEDEHGEHEGMTLFEGGDDGEHGEAAFVEDADFKRYGIDFNWIFDDVNVFGAYVRGTDDIRSFAADEMMPEEPGEMVHDLSGEFTYKAWFIETDVVLGYPWLHAAARWEAVELPKVEDDVPVEDWERGILSLTALVRANIKTTIEYARDLNESRNDSFVVSLAIAF